MCEYAGLDYDRPNGYETGNRHLHPPPLWKHRQQRKNCRSLKTPPAKETKRQANGKQDSRHTEGPQQQKLRHPQTNPRPHPGAD